MSCQLQIRHRGCLRRLHNQGPFFPDQYQPSIASGQIFKSFPIFKFSSLGLKLARTGLEACFAFYAGEPLSSLETPLRLKLTNAENTNSIKKSPIKNTNSIKNTNPFQPKFSRHLQHEHSALHSLQFMLAACRFKPHICILYLYLFQMYLYLYKQTTPTQRRVDFPIQLISN